MKSVQQRVQEFVQYHINGDGECNNVVLKKWAERNCRNLQERYELAYFFSITYCVESAIVLFKEREKVLRDISNWVKENKEKLIFQSDRKYIRMKDSFERCLSFFLTIRSANDFIKSVSEGGMIKLSKAIPAVSAWPLFGRFSAFLFLETLVELTGTPIENTVIEWKKGDTATSGLMNVYACDKAADHFDKTGVLKIPESQMDKMLAALLKEIIKAGGSPNITEVETSLCAYRKFYKGSRYNGYYLDRMLEEILKMRKKYPEISAELFEIRRECFEKKYLGELSGWNGIRPEMKKLYKNTGIIT